MINLVRSAAGKWWAAVAVTAALLVPLAVFGASAFARSASAAHHQYGQPGSAQYQYQHNKVTICHHTGSKANPWVQITVSSSAVPAHLRHGDKYPPCSTQAGPTPTPPSQNQGSNQHGNGNGHGNGHHGKP
jgi:ABC-type sugar transport system substrate-binding protein